MLAGSPAIGEARRSRRDDAYLVPPKDIPIHVRLLLLLDQILNVELIVVENPYCCLLLVLNSNNNNFSQR